MGPDLAPLLKSSCDTLLFPVLYVELTLDPEILLLAAYMIRAFYLSLSCEFAVFRDEGPTPPLVAKIEEFCPLPVISFDLTWIMLWPALVDFVLLFALTFLGG